MSESDAAIFLVQHQSIAHNTLYKLAAPSSPYTRECVNSISTMGDTCVDDVPRLGITLPHLLALVVKIEALARADDDGARDPASPPSSA